MEYNLNSVIVKTLKSPTTEEEQTFSAAQKSFWKSAEIVNAVHSSRWNILNISSLLWHESEMNNVVKCSAILRNTFI